MKFVIMGCGRVGASLAEVLDSEGHDVTVIDTNPNAFSRIDPSFGGTILVGTGVDEDVLRRAGIEDATGFAAVTDDDNANIMASQVAKLAFNVPNVSTRVYDPAREDVFKALGLDIISPARLGATQLKDWLEKGTPVTTCNKDASK
jgi:trk system potassium uptake protein TrkA